MTAEGAGNAEDASEGRRFEFVPASGCLRSPFYRRTLEAGAATWDVYNHMLTPASYGDEMAEYWHLVEKVTLWDVAVERQVEIEGPDAGRFTQLLTPRDLSGMRPGQCRYVVLCAPDGGIVNDPVLLKLAEDRFWLSLADSDALLYALGVQAFAGMDVEIREPDVSPLQIQGPRSVPLIRKLFGDAVADQRYYHCTETDLDGIPLVVSRTGWSAELGYEVFLRDSRHGTELWDRVMAAGEEFELRPIAPNEARRMEAGILSYGNDMTIVDNPFEVSGLERLAQLDNDNDVVSRDALTRIREEGVRRKLVGVRIDDDLPDPGIEGWSVVTSGDEIGRLTATSSSPRLGFTMGYAWVPIELASEGSRIEIVSASGDAGTAIVTSLPFLDPKKEIPTGAGRIPADGPPGA